MVENNNLTIQQFNYIVLGGTFDHFHIGHEALLTKAFETGKKVTIGIATEELYKNKFLSETIASFAVRKKSVSDFLKKKGWLSRAKIISFSHFTGGADKEKNIEAIIVSKETNQNALKINELRKKNRLLELKIIIVNDVLAEDSQLISSERIREGEIDRKGRKYQILNIKNQKEIIMPESLRKTLQKPLGVIFKNEKSLLRCIDTSKYTLIIAVGDIIVDSLLKTGIDPDVKVIDLKSRRVRTDLFTEHQLVKNGPPLVNNPGTINLKTAEIIKEKIKSAIYKKEKSWIVVDGEEDLLALPAILFAPLGSWVLYSHWEQGIIAVEINEKIKNKVKAIIDKFT